MPSSSSSVRQQRKLPGAENIVSMLLTQDAVDALCEKHGVPKGFTARLAGDLRVSSVPPSGAVCVYAHTLKAGMRVPLHGFFCQTLAHFGIAPAQLTPNGWRIMAGFLAICHSAGVPPSLAVFRHFFVLSIVNSKEKGWYFFRSKDNSGLRFTGMPTPRKDWRNFFFFLSSPEPWPCPVEWGEPSKTSLIEPLLSGEENRWAAKLLRAHGGGAVDLSTYLRDSNLAAAAMGTTTPPPPPSTTRATLSCEVYDMLKTMRAEKAAAQSANKVKAEPGSEAQPLCGEKKSLEESNGVEVPPPSAVTGVSSPPRGFSGKPRHFPGRNAGDSTEREAARELLQGAVAPSQGYVFAATEPSDIIASSHVAVLQPTNYTSFSLSYTLVLQEKLAVRDAEIAALRKALEETSGELAAAKRTEETERENAEATEAMRQLLRLEESVRRRAEHALEGYKRWKDSSSSRRAARRT